MEKPEGPINIFSSFVFLKLDPGFRRLVSNEKIAAKQEFENMVAACQEKVFLRTYMTSGLRADADILFWRVSDDLERLQDICARTFSSGAGQYLTPTHSYLGVYHPDGPAGRTDGREFGFLPKNSFGRHKFMLLHPLVKSQQWYELPETERRAMLAERETVLTKYADIRESVFQSYGLDGQEMIVAREARRLDELISATRELRDQRGKNFTTVDKPVFLCVGRDLREILDTIN
jgi:chlorite dismutase